MTNSVNIRKFSKFLSYVLRHKPDELDLKMDRGGWVEVDALLSGAKTRDSRWNRKVLEEVVRENNKQRFEFDETGDMIRARQGHSVDVDLGYTPVEPPEKLFHGTVPRFLDSILEEGLNPQSRHHVHLSEDVQTAEAVGSRRGNPVILEIDAQKMHTKGEHTFFCTDNDVWLVNHVPPEFLTVIK